MRISIVVALCLAGVAACGGSSRPRAAAAGPAGTVCYELDFGQTRPGIAPDRVALLPGSDGGPAVWLPSPAQRSGEHLLVGSAGRWRGNADSLRIEFLTPRTSSVIVLHRGTMRGRAGGMSDGAVGIWDWRPASARRFACPTSTPAG